jgi:DNA-binding SARP family transcriptional activator/tetratricopeptide (TPR) repeat protein
VDGKLFELNLLGAPTMTWQGAPFDMRRRQARALLYCLAAAMQLVARDALILLLWPELDDATARRNLTRLLSALQRELPHPDILQTTHTAVALNPHLATSDAATFATLAAGEDVAQWETAVALVRGPFLDGFSLANSAEFDLWQSRQQHSFEQRYLALLAELVRANRRRGQLAAAIAYARRYLTTDDLAEEMHRHLIELYAQNGDRSAALRQFEQCILVLERELGVAPLPETRAAYEAAHDGRPLAAPEPPPEPEWAVLPTLDLPLLGRDEPLAALTAAYGRLRRGGVIFISGEAGVGKSRLMRAFARRSGALVLTGNSHAETANLSYQPLVQALRQALPLRRRWQQTAPIWLAETARLLPELHTHFPSLPPALEVEPAQAQARLFEALHRLFGALSTGGPLLLCLDDVHWADGATRGWLHYLTGRLGGSQICILATYRAPEQAAVAQWQRLLQRTNLMAEVTLSGLAETTVAGLLGQLPQKVPQPQQLAERIHRATGGNSFFVLETMRELISRGPLTDVPAVLPLPSTVREAVLRRVGRLAPLTRQVLEVTAVLSPHAGLEAVAKTAGRDGLETAVSLEELVDKQLLSSDGDRFQFQHELAREAIYEAISPWRRRLLHRRAASALQNRIDTADELAAIAFHFEAAGDVLAAIDFYRQAAAGETAVYAHQGAVDHLQKCLTLARQTPETAAFVPQLQEALGDNLMILGNFAEAEAAYRELLTTRPEENVLWLAEIYGKLAGTLPSQQRAVEAEQVYRQALARLETAADVDKVSLSSIKLNLLLGLLDAIYFQFIPELMAELQSETEALLAAVGTLEQQVSYYSRLNQMAFLQQQFRSAADSVERARHALALARKSGSRRLIGRQSFHLGFQLLWSGKLDDAEEFLQQALTAAENLGDSWLHVQSLTYLSILYRLTGNTDRLYLVLPTFSARAQENGHEGYIGVAQAQHAWQRFHAGEWSHARSEALAALAAWADTAYPFEWLAHLILLALSLQANQLLEAIDACRAMLLPKQQKLPSNVESVLQTAVSAWEADDVAGAREGLETAVNLAHQHGYL